MATLKINKCIIKSLIAIAVEYSPKNKPCVPTSRGKMVQSICYVKAGSGFRGGLFCIRPEPERGRSRFGIHSAEEGDVRI